MIYKDLCIEINLLKNLVTHTYTHICLRTTINKGLVSLTQVFKYTIKNFRQKIQETTIQKCTNRFLIFFMINIQDNIEEIKIVGLTGLTTFGYPKST